MTVAPTPLPAKKGTGKPQTPEQAEAGKRNFAMFQLKGMLAHLKHLHGQVSAAKILDIQMIVQAALAELAHPAEPKLAAPTVPYLEFWSLHKDMVNQQFFLRGAIYNSSKHFDSTPVRTSYLCGANRAAGTVTTVSGSTYLLRGGDAEQFNQICNHFGV